MAAGKDPKKAAELYQKWPKNVKMAGDGISLDQWPI
jgi:hypothetical protein